MTAFEQLQQAYELGRTEVTTLQARVVFLEQEVHRLQELLQLQQARLFGKKSEKSTTLGIPTQDSTDTQDNELGEPASDAPPASDVTVCAHVRAAPRRGKRQLDAKSLPRYTLTYDVPESQRQCSCCGGALHPIGKERSEQLELIPVQYCIIEHLRLKYGCRSCDTVVMAPKPLAPLPKAIAGPSVLTDVILSKYQYHLPLYRQSKIMRTFGITLSDKTLANWVMQAGQALEAVYDAFWVILKNRYLQVDETPVKVLETNSKGYVWAYYAPNMSQGLVVFEFNLTRKGSVVGTRLKTFNGLLQTDGYKGYDALRKRQGIIGFGCLSHARRKFSEVIKIKADPHGIAASMIARLKPLYELEALFLNPPQSLLSQNLGGSMTLWHPK